MNYIRSMVQLFSYYRFIIIIIFTSLLYPLIFAREEPLLEEISQEETFFRHRILSGFLYSGGSAEDLDEGIFSWDYVTYSSYRYQLDEKNLFRINHQYWKYLSGDYRNLYKFEWWHRLKDYKAYSIALDYLEDKEDYEAGNVYFGYQSRLGKDLQWFAQVGMGMDSDHKFNTSLSLEAIKPLSPTTVLRVCDDYSYSTSGYQSNALRINLIQALHRRLAMNLGYRFFVNEQDEEDVEDITSHEGSLALIYQIRDNMFLTGRYRHYWNNQDVRANIYSLENRWNISKRLSVVGGYEFQQYNDGPTNHGFLVGMWFDF